MTHHVECVALLEPADDLRAAAMNEVSTTSHLECVAHLVKSHSDLRRSDSR